jgi:hypothetical protein
MTHVPPRPAQTSPSPRRSERADDTADRSASGLRELSRRLVAMGAAALIAAVLVVVLPAFM